MTYALPWTGPFPVSTSVTQRVEMRVSESAMSRAKPIALSQIQRDYVITNASAVLAELAASPDLADAVAQVASILRAHFVGAQLHLEPYRGDPDEPAQLALSIGTTATPDAALDALHAFDDAWWLDQPWTVRQHLLINLRFI